MVRQTAAPALLVKHASSAWDTDLMSFIRSGLRVRSSYGVTSLKGAADHYLSAPASSSSAMIRIATCGTCCAQLRRITSLTSVCHQKTCAPATRNFISQKTPGQSMNRKAELCWRVRQYGPWLTTPFAEA